MSVLVGTFNDGSDEFTDAQPHWNENTILALSLSKMGMNGIRTGIVVAREDIIRAYSTANGIINFMGGLGALLVFFGGKPLYDRDVSLPFLVGGLVMFAACMLVVMVALPTLSTTRSTPRFAVIL